nr:glycosyltransferase family 2 protein [uncultured Ralstonia sp.]
MTVQVAAILVNWRQPELTMRAVEYLRRQTLVPDIFVVENGSGDNSVDILKARLPSDVRMLVNHENVGFGKGCNTAIKKILENGFDYIWLINNDAVPDENCLANLVSVAQASRGMAVVGGRIVDDTGEAADHTGTVMGTFSLNCKSTLSEEELRSMNFSWITGACMLLPVEAVRKNGCFDEGYFMYWEDADLCMRMRASGCDLKVADKAIVYHTAGTSSDNFKSKRFDWHLTSLIRFVKKHHRFSSFAIAVIYARHIVKSVLTRDWDRFRNTISHIAGR